MDACGCQPPGPEPFASIFDGGRADADLRAYRRNGPSRSTRLLLDLLAPHRRPGVTLLDIGGGIGAIDQSFLAHEARSAVLVEGSPAFLEAARDEAERTHTTDRMQFRLGDFVRLAPEIERADVVTLDRVVCCYPDVDALVRLSAARAREVYGLVLPRDRRLFRLFAGVANVGARLRRQSWRLYAHPNAAVDALLASAGFVPRAERRTLIWRAVVYERTRT